MVLSRGQRLRRLREQKGVEGQVAASAIGVSGAMLSQLEHDKKGKNLRHMRTTFERAAAYYEVIPEYLMAETPQEYMVALVHQEAGLAELDTFGKRLSWVVDEMCIRWGEAYSEAAIAERLGTTIGALQEYRKGTAPPGDDSFLRHLSELSGVPVDFFVRGPVVVTDDVAWRRINALVEENGIPLAELEHVIQAWLMARSNTKKPSA